MSRWQGLGTVVSVKSLYSYLVELEQGQSRWLHANKLRPYHARVNALIGTCAIVYESDEEFGTLPVTTPEYVDLNLPSVKIDHTKLEHLNADQKDAVLYASRKLLPREQNYSVDEREALAIIWAVDKCHGRVQL